jgi:NADPH2:quinone reductase
MRAALCRTLDGPDAITIEEIADPAPEPGKVVLRVEAAALNFLDTLITRGKYQYKPALPFSPAAECAGVVEAVGPGVTGLAPGDRVCGYLGWGAAREKVVADPAALVRLPDGVSSIAAAGISVTYGTALHGLLDRGGLRAGETVAVLGAAGGAGLAAVEIAKALGARPIAVASGPEKLALCREHGAEAGIDYTREDLKQRLRDLTDGRGVDVVYDCVGGPYAEQALRSIAWGGRFLVVGFAAGEIPRIPLNLLLLKNAAMLGVFWGEMITRDPAMYRDGLARVLAWIAEGKLAPHVHATYPLADIGCAIRSLEDRSVRGKVVVTL